MTTATETTTEAIEHLDFHPDIACEGINRTAVHKGHDQPADYWSIATCCGRPPIPMCTPCVTDDNRKEWSYCAFCNKEDSVEDPIRRYEPINGGTK